MRRESGVLPAPFVFQEQESLVRGVARRVVAPHVQAGGCEQAVQLVEAMSHGRRDAFAAPRDNGVPPLGEGAGDDGGLDPRTIVSTTTNGIPANCRISSMSRSSAPTKALNETCLSRCGDSPTGAALPHRRQAAQEPLGIRQPPAAGVRGRGRRAAQHLMAEANEGAEVDARDLDQYRVWIHGSVEIRLLESPSPTIRLRPWHTCPGFLWKASHGQAETKRKRDAAGTCTRTTKPVAAGVLLTPRCPRPPLRPCGKSGGEQMG